MTIARTWRSLFLPKADWAMVAAGAGAAACAFAGAAGAWWWASAVAANRASQVAQQRTTAMVQTLASTIESEMSEDGSEAGGGLGRVRRLVADAALLHGLSTCRLELPNGEIVADADPRRINVKELPGAGAWPKARRQPLDAALPVQPADDGAAPETLTAVRMGESGEASLVVAGAPKAEARLGDALAGAACVGLVAAAGSWCMMSLVRRRVGSLGVLRGAVMAAGAGQDEPSSLELHEGHGEFAGAWNGLVRERAAMRQRETLERIIERASTAAPREADLTSACDAMWAGLVLVDDQQCVRYVNGAAAVFLAGKREELVGKPINDVLSEPEIAEALGAIGAGKGRGKVVVEIKRRGSAGPKLADEQTDRRGQPAWAGGVLRVSIRPIRRCDTGTAMLVIEDVTQQRVADEARNSFVAQATHELRTPLTNIRLYIEQLTDDENLDAQARGKAINVVNQEARRLERIVADMLSVSEIEAGSLKLRTGDVRLGELLRQLQDDYKPQAGAKEISLSFDLAPKLPVLSGDRDKIGLAVHNLLGNAIKYTPAGGAVSLKADASADGQTAIITISDNGIGIKPDECEKVFEKFYRAQDRRINGITGSGLGLALAREVARMHGGDITLATQIDKGSTFTLTLPVGAASGSVRPVAKAA